MTDEVEFVPPREKVRAAMPGTLGELAERTGYPAGEVMRQIVRLRRDGVRVNAVEDGTRSVSRHLDSEAPHSATTVYTVEP